MLSLRLAKNECTVVFDVGTAAVDDEFPGDPHCLEIP